MLAIVVVRRHTHNLHNLKVFLMPIYELGHDALSILPGVTFASKGILEEDIQRIFRTHIGIIAPDTFVIAEEFSDWTDSWRSIDLLCLDKEANLIVVELKRTTDGGHMELQAIRYAAMISKMTFADAVTAHSRFLSKNGEDGSNAQNALLEFLGWDQPKGSDFGKDVRIILVSADFSKEITTSVLWLNERELDIRCVRLRPYEFMGKTLVDIQQLLPLPEAVEYQVQIRKKAAEERSATEGGIDWTRYDLVVGAETFSNLYKRQLFRSVIRALVERGVLVSELQQIIPASKFVGVTGKLNGAAFRDAVATMRTAAGAKYDFRRFYLADDDLFFSEGATWALSNQWSISFLPQLDQLVERYPQAALSYKPSEQELSVSRSG